MTDITLESYVTKIDVSDDEIALLVDNKEIDNLIDSSIVKSKKYIINEKIIVKIRYIKKITLTFDKSKNVLSEDDLSNNASTKEHAITSVNKPPNHWSADCQMIASPGTIILLKNHDPVVVDNELDINNMSKKYSSKDIAYFIQTGTRTFEYQDTAKSYIGFRCVVDFLGRDKKDFQ